MMVTPDESPTPINVRADLREEFIRNFFLIAVSVGFAEHIARILLHPNYNNFAQHSLLLDPLILNSWKEIVLLLIGMIIVIQSWQWYLGKIRVRPLEDGFRFWLDIVITVAYLVILLTSQLYDVWFWTVAFVWVCYGIWDVALLAWDHDRHRSAPIKWNRKAVVSVGRAVLWAALFVILALFRNPETTFGFWCDGAVAFGGAVFYRQDQRERFRFWHILLIIAFWLGIVALGRYLHVR